MGPGSDGLANLDQMCIHRGCRTARQNEAGGHAGFGTDRPKQIGRCGALTMRRRSPGAAFRSAPGDAALLTDPRFVPFA